MPLPTRTTGVSHCEITQHNKTSRAVTYSTPNSLAGDILVLAEEVKRDLSCSQATPSGGALLDMHVINNHE